MEKRAEHGGVVAALVPTRWTLEHEAGELTVTSPHQPSDGQHEPRLRGRTRRHRSPRVPRPDIVRGRRSGSLRRKKPRSRLSPRVVERFRTALRRKCSSPARPTARDYPRVSGCSRAPSSRRSMMWRAGLFPRDSDTRRGRSGRACGASAPPVVQRSLYRRCCADRFRSRPGRSGSHRDGARR